MSAISSTHYDVIAALLNPPLCANTKGKANEQSPCQKSAKQACSSCRLVQYCSKECQIANWPHHKRICKSDLMKSRYVPGWIKENRNPSWVSDTGASSNFGVNQYLWGNMPAVDILNLPSNEGVGDTHGNFRLLFAASGDIRNVVKSVADGLPDGYDGKCTLVINDLNFIIVARNAILLFVALSLEIEEAVAIMLHLWYSVLLPDCIMTTLRQHVLGLIADVCEKIKDKNSRSLQAKTFFFGKRSLRLVLMKQQWDELKNYFNVPQDLTQNDAQEIRRRCMLAPERVDYLHRALCNQPASIRVATVTFREDGLLLPHGTSREQFTVPNPTFFHEDLIWPMKDDANPLEGWDYYDYKEFAPRATNDVMGSFFFFLKDILSRFCKRITKSNIHFVLFNVDARELPGHLSVEESKFDRIEVSNVCDRGYIGPKKTLSIFGPLLSPKAVKPKATLLMLFLNAVNEVYFYRGSEGESNRMKESQALIKKFLPVTPMTLMSMMTGGINSMRTPEMIQLSSCYTMFGDFDKAFDSFLQDVRMQKLAYDSGMKVKEKHTLVEPWPLRITEQSTMEEFDMRCATSHLGSERYMEFEKR